MEKAKAKGRGGERGRKKGKKKEGKRKQNLKEARKGSKRRKAKAILNPQREVGVQGLIRRFVLLDIINLFLAKIVAKWISLASNILDHVHQVYNQLWCADLVIENALRR